MSGLCLPVTLCLCLWSGVSVAQQNPIQYWQPVDTIKLQLIFNKKYCSNLANGENVSCLILLFAEAGLSKRFPDILTQKTLIFTPKVAHWPPYLIVASSRDLAGNLVGISSSYAIFRREMGNPLNDVRKLSDILLGTVH